MTIVFDLHGRFSLPFSVSKPTVFPPPFCLAPAHAQPLSPQCYCLLPTCDPTYSSQLPASTRNKKSQTKKPASRCFRCISGNRAAYLFSFVFVARPVAELLPVSISLV